jgi:hypothetical protein
MGFPVGLDQRATTDSMAILEHLVKTVCPVDLAKLLDPSGRKENVERQETPDHPAKMVSLAHLVNLEKTDRPALLVKQVKFCFVTILVLMT